MRLRTPLARARGVGSAKEGTGHWWAQRLTSLALVPLSLWFAASLLAIVGADHASAVQWLQSPLRATLLMLLIAIAFHHGQLGMQVVIEDYVAHEGVMVAAIILVKFLALLLSVACILAVLRIAVGM
ncbi:MAG: succinate dehydrogenase, hydrophobic membrane anchor protein [Gammaproteobacteria bacterium]|nr:MAG: succinate dehydrogenase, hydrophobic membrane anchor protein [Gammaproteobacteria bacterium]